MESWFLFALASVFVLAGSEISQKISLTQKVTLSAVTNNFYVWSLQGSLALFLAFLFSQFSFSTDLSSLGKLLLVGIVYFFGGTFFYTSYKGNSPSISVILGSISVIVSTLLGIVFFQESTTTLKFIGITLILVSIVSLNVTIREKFSKYNLYALIGGICFGVAYTLDKSFVLQNSPFMYLSLMCFTVAMVSILLRPKQIVTESRGLKIPHFYPMILASVFGTLFNLFTFLSYSNGSHVGVVDAMNNSSVFLIILIEILILKDRSSLFKKIFCAGLAFGGIAIFALGRF